MGRVSIHSIEAENLRGYDYTKLKIQSLTVLVGENNEGKSSLLKMLDRLLQLDSKFWAGDRVLDESAFAFWHPANRAKHRARRFSINVEILDGNFGRRFRSSRGDVLPLRFAVKSADGECRLNVGAPKRSEAHDENAVVLLEEIRRSCLVKLLPPVRDAQSSAFAEKVTSSVKKRVQKKLSHSRQAGSPKEYRLALEVVEKVREIIELNKENLHGQSHSPLAGMMRSNEVRVDLKASDVARLIDNALYLYVSTGDHDVSMVPPGETGNGLQSLIDIDMSLASLPASSQQEVVLIVEEPEAFLHPSAQRQFMRYLRHSLESGRVTKAILTTHSPIVVDEARFEEVVIVRGQRHFQPEVDDSTRLQINTSLMSVATSEAFFARTVVLVEGEADKALLNTLIRRVIEEAGADSNLCGIVIQPTGSCTFFAPWFRLIDAYTNSGGRAFKSLWIMDADAACAEGGRAAIKGCADAGRGMKDDVKAKIQAFGDLPWDIGDRSAAVADQVNVALRDCNGRFFSCDLEWALFNGASTAAIASIRRSLDRCGINSTGSSKDLARRLGSKIGSGKASDGARKNPYVRAAIAQDLPFAELPPEIRQALKAIFDVALPNQAAVSRVLAHCKI